MKRILGTMVALALVLTACASTSTDTTSTDVPSADSTTSTTSGSGETTTTPPVDQEITLEVWAVGSSPERVTLLTDHLDAFAEEFPGVTIDFSSFPFEDMATAMRLALDSGVVPDIALVSPGATGMGAYGEAGTLLDLTQIAEERGWNDRMSESVIRFYNPPDKLWGFPNEVAAVGVFYNKGALSDLGLSVPQTWAEFEALLAAVKASGQTPFSVGGLDRWPVAHIMDNLIHAYVPIENIRGLVNLDPDSAWNTPEMVEAAEVLNSWFESGYFSEDSPALSYGDSNAEFITEKVAMSIGGTWNIGSFDTDAEFDVGFFPMPAVPALSEWHMGGYTPESHWVIPIEAEHVDMAIEALDFLISDQVALALWNTGALITYEFAENPPPANPIQADVYAATQIVGTGYYVDAGAAEVRDTYFTVLQEMQAGRLAPSDAMDQMQAAHEASIARK